MVGRRCWDCGEGCVCACLKWRVSGGRDVLLIAVTGNGFGWRVASDRIQW